MENHTIAKVDGISVTREGLDQLHKAVNTNTVLPSGFEVLNFPPRKVTPMPEIMVGLIPEVVANIRAEQKSGRARTVAGRPWWVSAFSQEELTEAGLI